MKKLVTATCKYEGKKSSVFIGNVREITKVQATITAASMARGNTAFVDEINLYTQKIYEKCMKKIQKNPEITEEQLIKIMLGKK